MVPKELYTAIPYYTVRYGFGRIVTGYGRSLSQRTTQWTTLHVVPGCSLAGSDLQCSGPGSNIGVNLLTSSKMYHRARTNDASSLQLIPPLITPLTSLTSLTTVH